MNIGNVTTVLALRSTRPHSHGASYVSVLGGAAIGDGGGGTWYWDSTSVLTDNASTSATTATVVAYSGSSTGRWRRAFAQLSERDALRIDACNKLEISPSQLTDHFSTWGDVEAAAGTTGNIVADTAGMRVTDSGGSVGNMAFDAGGGGVFRFKTNAVNGASGRAYGPIFLPPTDTGKGYWSALLKFETAIDAQTDLRWCLYYQGIAVIGVGHKGSLSTTKIVFTYDATKLDLLTTDTQWHRYAMWWKGDGKVHVSVDGVEIGSGITPAATITPLLRDLLVYENGTTNANRSLLCQDRYLAAGFP